MGILEIVGAFLQLLLLIFTKWFSTDADRKKQLQEAHDEVKEGIRTRDRAKITAGFARANRM